MQTSVISLGGSIINSGRIDLEFLKGFRELVLKYTHNNRLIVVCGGGKPARDYQEALDQFAVSTNINISNQEKDWVGIMATRLNAELLRCIFLKEAHLQVIYNPNLKIISDKKLIIAAGYEPGCSTDYDAVLLARQFMADKVINASNIDYVYDSDPKKFKDAKPFKKLTWKEYKALVGGKFVPGMHAPFDPVASKLAEKENMKVIILNGSNLANLEKALLGKEFKGTVIG
ncbi:UMP kinase [Candidatus Woesearchaeota archaeon]|nr:UMP kinase [Candidatus Woesearchaeota archaeon]